MLKHNNIHLVLMEKKHIINKVQWVNDPEVRNTMFFDNISEVGTSKWLDQVSVDPTREDYIVLESERETPIGFASVVNIDYKNSKAETYICIGEKSYWGMGYGTDVKRILMRHVFKNLALNKLYSFNWAENEGMVYINQKLGFTKEGVLRSDRLANGEWKDRVLFSMLKSEYDNLNN
ncbi:GNAT family N-acetyltransferase [Salisediminibacterium halotolerans]|uniref:GNAT family N-acetyltransferase n=1 Tax=Salisediminibacterium halotolerans TaxID=517425 RepID=UPI000EB03A44|nr:GNAT family protein [Salisediminibacterium halotolerans]RLJ75720.1 RimJ/RimL family protein N-acetyltransferase [Actinophytocola xinjiangensis]RPE89574.1 RimJ/RimL family protein N-acetyltransferase [Salisediminibacterium halotolerans]TWG36333.1 RimJ/RimL family protein N-acetyltransferase [Salisediminibacterium halotolerans]GEL07219.1 acetyltransferase [Salisediminibacterium halotolerans]